MAPAHRCAAIRIPIVVRVVRRSALENLSLRRIRSQLTVLKRDFRARTPDRKRVPAVWQGLVSDTGIEFELGRASCRERVYGTV